MPRNTPLHAADDLLMPALDRAIEAIDPPPADAALVALARILAHAVDRMSNAERAAMLGQTAPQVLRVLVELEKRAQQRRGPDKGKPENPVRAMRRAHMAAVKRRGSS